MLTQNLQAVAKAVAFQIIKVFPDEYLRETLSGKSTLKDIVLQILVECCKYAYDNTQERHSLNYYLGGAASVDVSERMMHQRTMNYIREKRQIQDRVLRSEGWIVNDLAPKELKGIKEKLRGHSLNSFQFWEVCNIHDMRLVKAVVDKRIGKNNFTSKNMQELSEEYDSYLASLQKDWYGDNKNGIFDFLAMFTLEWKYSFDFYYEIADTMEKRNIKSISKMKERIGLFSAQLRLYSDLLLTHPGILPGPMLAENRMLVTRRKYIEDIISADEKSFEHIKRQFMGVQVILSAMLSQMTLNGIQIREWFIDNTNQDDWLSAFKEYDVFQSFVAGKLWDKKKTRCVKNIYNEMSVDYKNPDFRS